MGKKMLLLVVLVVVCLCGSALALDPMGPPVAGLNKGQWSAGLDYAFSETDLDFDGEFSIMDYDGDSLFPSAIPDKLTFEAVEMHKGYLNIGYGITDEVDVFLRLGGARAEAQKPTRYIEHEWGYPGEDPIGGIGIFEDGPCHDWDTGFALGFGGKATLYEDSDLKIGVLGQASWTKMDIRVKYQGLMGSGGGDPNIVIPNVDGLWAVPSEGELEMWEVQIAVGASYDLSPGFAIYGGPFFYWLDGEYDFDGCGQFMLDADPGAPWFDIQVDGSYDVENDSEFGGYAGAQIQVTDNVNCSAECIITGDAIGVGTNLSWLF